MLIRNLFLSLVLMGMSVSAMAAKPPTLIQVEQSLIQNKPVNTIDLNVKKWTSTVLSFDDNVTVTYQYGYGLIYKSIIQYHNPTVTDNKQQSAANQRASELLKDEIVHTLESNGYHSVWIRSMNPDSNDWMLSFEKEGTYAKVQMSKLERKNYVITVTFDNMDINTSKDKINNNNQKELLNNRKSLL